MKINFEKEYLNNISKEFILREVLRLKFNDTLSTIKAKSIKKGIPFGVTIDDLVFNSHCPVLGIELDYFNNVVSDNSPSIDKIIPKLGYIKGNVEVISMKANRIKSNGSIDEILKIAEYIQKTNTIK